MHNLSNIVFPPRFLASRFLVWQAQNRYGSTEIKYNPEYNDPLRVGDRGLREMIEQSTEFQIVVPGLEID